MPVMLCSADDCAQLARMNRRLIEDEGHDNPMDDLQLTQRMDGFLRGGYRAYLYLVGSDVVGYALVKMDASSKYLRHFYIERERRRQGHGRAFFNALMAELGESAIDIEVLWWNERGRAFWESLGFQPRSVYMRRKVESTELG